MGSDAIAALILRGKFDRINILTLMFALIFSSLFAHWYCWEMGRGDC
jgi:hypothetical protein